MRKLMGSIVAGGTMIVFIEVLVLLASKGQTELIGQTIQAFQKMFF